MPTYDRAPRDVTELVADVLAEKRQDLVDIDLKVDLLMAHPTEREAERGPPCIKLHGYPCEAIARIIPYKQRVKGMGDVEIVFDARTWESKDDEGRRALIWHELLHFEIARDRDGNRRTDDLGRPKIEMRLHDIEIGAFHEVIAEYGLKSTDGRMVHDAIARYRQRLMDWGDDGTPQDEAPRPTIRRA